MKSNEEKNKIVKTFKIKVMLDPDDLEKKRLKLKEKVCPSCSKKNKVIRILYGYPNDDNVFEKEKEGKLRIGGCVVSNDSPKYYCKRCDLEFGK